MSQLDPRHREAIRAVVLQEAASPPRRTGLTVALVAAIVVLVLVGGGVVYAIGATHTGRTTAHPGSTIAANPTPTVSTPSGAPTEAGGTPTPIDPPPLDSLIITPTGLGSLQLGSPIAASKMVRFDPTYCQEVNPTAGPDVIGRWVPNYPGADSSFPFATLSNPGPNIRFIVIFGPGPHTATGIHIGSTEAELRAAYPTLQGDSPDNGRSSAKWVDLPTGRLWFEFLDPSDADVGPAGTVISITISPNNGETQGRYWGVDAINGCL